MRRFTREFPEGHLQDYIFEPVPVTGLAQLGVRDDETMPQATPSVVDTPKSESTDLDEIARMPRGIRRLTEEHSPSYTPVVGNSNTIEAVPCVVCFVCVLWLRALLRQYYWFYHSVPIFITIMVSRPRNQSYYTAAESSSHELL